MSGSGSESRQGLPERIGGYEPLIQLASGGMATLFVARQLGSGGVERLVALKRVHPHLLLQADFRNMFLDEARLASLIQHPNVVHLLAVEELDGELILVLEYVESVTLSRLLTVCKAAHVTLPPAIVSRIGCDLLAGLHCAHEAVGVRGNPLGIVHRDVSPQNVIIGTDGASRLIDFGIARAADRVTETASGVIKGKHAYLAPEILLGKEPDRRADLFAVGLVLLEALTGEQAYEDEAVLYKRVFESISPTLAAELESAAQLEEVVKRATRRERDLRYDTAEEMLEALERAAAPAPAREVARWVQQHCGQDVILRRASIQEALDARTRVDGRRPMPSAQIAPEAAPTPRPAERAPRSWARLLALVLVVAAFALSAVVILMRSRPAAVARDARPSASLPAATTSPVSAAPPETVTNPAPDADAVTSSTGTTRPPRVLPSRSAAQPSATVSAPTPLHSNPYQPH